MSFRGHERSLFCSPSSRFTRYSLGYFLGHAVCCREKSAHAKLTDQPSVSPLPGGRRYSFRGLSFCSGSVARHVRRGGGSGGQAVGHFLGGIIKSSGTGSGDFRWRMVVDSIRGTPLPLRIRALQLSRRSPGRSARPRRRGVVPTMAGRRNENCGSLNASFPTHRQPDGIAVTAAGLPPRPPAGRGANTLRGSKSWLRTR